MSLLNRPPSGVVLPSARGYAVVCGQCTSIGYADASTETDSWQTFSALGWRVVRRVPYPAYALCATCASERERRA